MRAALALAAFAVAAPAPAAATPDEAHRGGVVRVEHRDPSSLPARGPANAPVTIELFFTPGPSSRSPGAYRNLERLQAQHPSQIRLVYRVLAVNGQARLPYAALEAYAEGKFFEFMDRLNCVTGPLPCKFLRTNLNNQDLLEMATDIGIDPDRLSAAMANPPAGYVKVLAANDRRRKHHIRNPPSLVALFNGRLPQTQLQALGPNDLEHEYRAAKELADDLLDRGAAPSTLADALDDGTGAPAPQDIVIQGADTDEDLDQQPSDPPLASPPLDLAGLPTYGPANAAVTIVVLCTPSSTKCRAPKDAAVDVQRDNTDSVRVVWAPFFDLAGPEAADHGMLGDAALCAERVGTSSADDKDFDDLASPGWRWVEAVVAEMSLRHRRVPAEQMIDKIAAKLHVDPHAFAACRAQLAGTALRWSERARRAGVRTTPATLVGGRIYAPIQDRNTLQQLIEVELAPGWLGEHAPAWRRRL